jgi:hypothetical protein
MVKTARHMIRTSMLGLMRLAWSPGRSAAYRAARRSAALDCDDEAARALLAQEVAPGQGDSEAALKLLGRNRDEFLPDRAFRLLYAVAHRLPVEPMRGETQEPFRREERLGKLPLATAYTELVELEPRLSDAESSKPSSSETPAGMPLSMLLGPNAQHSDPLVRSQLALSIAAQHEAVVRGELDQGQANISYFAAPLKRVRRSGTLIEGIGRGDSA